MRNRLLSAVVPLMLGVTLILPTAGPPRPALAQPMLAAGHTDHQDHRDHADHTGQLGSVQFATSCSPAIQADFNRSVAMYHSFWWEPAREAFGAIAAADPSCGMAYWGLALSWVQNPFTVPNPQWVQQGAAAAERAAAVGARTERERAFIAALTELFRDYETVPQATRQLNYQQAMERVYTAYPEDREAAVFYALSLAFTTPATDKTYANSLRGAAILEEAFAEQPGHPGVTHYLIHSYDYPPLAQQGAAAARRYASIAPAVPHAQHMPSHIFTRLGDWQDSIQANLGSVAAAWADADRAQPDVAPPDVLHPMDYLTYAYLQGAQDQRAARVRDEAQAFRTTRQQNFGEAFAFAAIPARYALERGQWSEAAALARHPSDFPWDRFPEAEAILVFARGLGAARGGDASSARQAVAQLEQFRDTLQARRDAYWSEQTEIQRQELVAWIALVEGRQAEALELMRAAAALEDTTEKAPVSPGPIVPARELLGDLLLLQNQPREALVAYAASEQVEPNRFRGLYGAARAAELAGEAEIAREYYTRLLVVSADADTDRPELQQARVFLARF
jgi:hypothetical protein